jgi:hypothetical protein
MKNFPLPLNANETILNSDEKSVYVKNSLLGYNVIFGTLWITSQRLVFQDTIFGNSFAYPVKSIAKAQQSDVKIYYKVSRYQSHTYDVALYLEFDNGGKEYFIPQDIAGFAQAILDTKVSAPSLPYTRTPPLRSAVEQGNRGVWVIFGIMGGIVVLFLCSTCACLVLPSLLSILGGNGR